MNHYTELDRLSPATRLNGRWPKPHDHTATRSPVTASKLAGGGFSLDTADRLGTVLRLSAPIMLLGLGTTGMRILQRLIQLVKQEVGRLPNALRHLSIDAALPDSEVAFDDFIGISRDGAGSDPHEGRRLYLNKYFEIRTSLLKSLQELNEADSLAPCLMSPREALAFWIFAGAGGGTSGGSLQPAIATCHDVAQELQVNEFRVNVVLMGADMPMRDTTRQQTAERKLLVPDTAASNLHKILADFRNPSIRYWKRPDGTTCPIRSSHAVWSVSVIDQNNGAFQYETTNDLIEMIALAYFFLLFTDAGKYLDERNCDDERDGSIDRA